MTAEHSAPPTAGPGLTLPLLPEAAAVPAPPALPDPGDELDPGGGRERE